MAAVFHWWCAWCEDHWRGPAEVPVKCPNCNTWTGVQAIEDRGANVPRIDEWRRHAGV
jgi:hypothetical protein